MVGLADSSKTEKATPKRRRDEREKGNIFFSNDAVSVLVLLCSFGVIRLMGPGAVEQLENFLRYCMVLASQPELPVTDQLRELLEQFVLTFVKAGGPILAAAVAMGVAATLFQTKMLISKEALKPKWERLNPIQGIKRLFSLRSLIEALKGILKISLLLWLIYSFLSDVVTLFPKYFYTDLPSAASHLFGLSFQLVMQILLAYIVLAGADVFYQWWDYERQLRMSKQEIKEEYKQTEGDPQVKGKIKQLQRRMAQSRMMQQVPQADVVIRNPTHFAVALRYHAETDQAPVVLAKGQDYLALRIVKMAEQHHVAVIENVPLARALYATTEVNQQIPPELYNAVAEVLVYLYRLEEKMK
ncbi:flagellar biosynthesis protein FlhB [Angelakisella massiliensis]|uniref:flagellar biosynthesis protein FlhB n=1 Tax=Angelakisella massiliensis TaxID=1871018 RepID=UPI001F3D3E6B|nr:flagellar biosynthesis protein FlhB [Angelakisella massiliensis]